MSDTQSPRRGRACICAPLQFRRLLRGGCFGRERTTHLSLKTLGHLTGAPFLPRPYRARSVADRTRTIDPIADSRREPDREALKGTVQANCLSAARLECLSPHGLIPTHEAKSGNANPTGPPDEDSPFLPSRERRREEWLGFGEYIGLQMPIVAVPCFRTGGGLDGHPAFFREVGKERIMVHSRLHAAGGRFG